MFYLQAPIDFRLVQPLSIFLTDAQFNVQLHLGLT